MSFGLLPEDGGLVFEYERSLHDSRRGSQCQDVYVTRWDDPADSVWWQYCRECGFGPEWLKEYEGKHEISRWPDFALFNSSQRYTVVAS